jgi:tetratricopeptide (TPR) repeat protein
MRAVAYLRIASRILPARAGSYVSASMIIWALLALVVTADDCQDAQALGRKAYEGRQYEQAAQQFARAVTACGVSTPLLLALGQAHLLAQRPADAVTALDRIPIDAAEYGQALKVKAKALYLLRRDAEAIDVLKQAASRTPQDAEILYDLGRIYYQIGRHADAAAAFKQATTLDPTAYKAWDNLGLAMEALGEVVQAQQHYLKALALVHKDHPHYDVVYANFADLLIKAGDYPRAFDLAAEAAQRNPDEPRNFFLAGKALVQLGRDDVSVKWLEQAISLNPDYPEPHYVLGQVYRRLGRPEDAARALKAFQAANARSPTERR